MSFTCLKKSPHSPAYPEPFKPPTSLSSLTIFAFVLATGAAWRLIPKVASELRGPGRGQPGLPRICLTLDIQSPPLPVEVLKTTMKALGLMRSGRPTACVYSLKDGGVRRSSGSSRPGSRRRREAPVAQRGREGRSSSETGKGSPRLPFLKLAVPSGAARRASSPQGGWPRSPGGTPSCCQRRHECRGAVGSGSGPGWSPAGSGVLPGGGRRAGERRGRRAQLPGPRVGRRRVL